MQMTNGTKINIFLAVSFMGLWTCNYFNPKEKREEIVIDNAHIDKKPCITIINQLFGKGVDSTKLCECLIPEYYQLIKSDSTLVEKFKRSTEFAKLEGPRQASLVQIFASCVKANIIDSNFKLNLIADYKLAFKDKLKTECQQRKEFNKIDPERLSNCVVDKFAENVTIGEYYSDDYFKVPKLKKIIIDCAKQSVSTK